MPNRTEAEKQEQRRAERRGRRRIVYISVLCSGAVALFIGRAFDTANLNSQVPLSRKNCQFIQDDRRAAVTDRQDNANSLNAEADRVLGNKQANLPPANFKIPPFSQFASFKQVIILQAKQQRADAATQAARAKATQARIENCAKVFPRHKAFWVF